MKKAWVERITRVCSKMSKSNLKFTSISTKVGIRSPGNDTPFGQFVHFHSGPLGEKKGFFDTRSDYRVSRLDFPPDLVKVTD